MNRKKAYAIIKPICIIAITILVALLTPVKVFGQNNASATDVKVLLSKVEKGTDTALSGAKLGLFEGENSAGKKIQDIVTTGSKIELSLKDGTYTLSELEAPADYNKAEDITFKVEGKKLYFKQGDKFVESENFETLASNNYEAFADRNDDTTSWQFTPYGKHYYLRENNGKGQVIYCFNIDLKEPVESYDDGATLEETFGEGEIKYTKIVNPLNLKGFAQKPREVDPQTFYNKIKKVIYAGFPNNKKNLRSDDLTDTEFKTATQLAIYYYTDNIDVATVTHGFEGIREDKGKKVKEIFDKLIAYAESDETVEDGFKINMFRSNNGKYQNMIGTSYNPDDLLYIINMENEKQPIPDYVAGKLQTTVKVGNVSAVLNAQDATQSKEATLEAADVTNKVTVTDTIQYSQLRSNTQYQVTARLMKIVDGQEPQEIAKKEQTMTSSQNGEGEWVMSFDNVTLEAGAKYVVFEKAETVSTMKFKEDGKTVEKKHAAIHEDKNDKAQTIIVNDKLVDSPLGSLQTTVSVSDNTGTELAKGTDNTPATLEGYQVNDKVTIKDSIDYKNLKSNAAYKVTTRLMKISGNSVVAVTDENGKAITQETEMTTSSTGSGTWHVTFDNVKLEPKTKYVVYEVAESVNEYELIESGKKVTKKQRIVHENKDDNAQTIAVRALLPDSPLGSLQTTVSVLDSNDKVLATGTTENPATLEGYQVNDNVSVKDSINYNHLKPDAKYMVSTRLMKISGDKVEAVTDENGKAITKETEMTTSSTGSGTWHVTFNNVKLEPKTKYVVYEVAESVDPYEFVEGGKKVTKKQKVTHENKDDKSQTVAVNALLQDSPLGSLQTTVSVSDNKGTVLATGTANVEATLHAYQVTHNVTVTDTIEYNHLVANAKYTLTTRLMKVSGNTVVAATDDKGNFVEKEIEMTASSTGSGTWHVTFNNVKLEPNTKYVVYEVAKSVDSYEFVEGGKKVIKKQEIEHANKDDKAQTIVVNEKLVDSPMGSLQTTVSVVDHTGKELAIGTVTTPATLEATQVDDKVTVMDTISYQNLVPNAKYRVTTRLMKVIGNNVELVTDENDDAIQQETGLIASATGTGMWRVSFGQIKLDPNTKYVVYEVAESVEEHEFIENGIKTMKSQQISHENMNDNAQTITVKEKVVPQQPKDEPKPEKPEETPKQDDIKPEEPKENPKQDEPKIQQPKTEDPKAMDDTKTPEMTTSSHTPTQASSSVQTKPKKANDKTLPKTGDNIGFDYILYGSLLVLLGALIFVYVAKRGKKH